ncbi:hypothetical protein [Mucilaginibacter sp.]|uniref:hypothetical protein n=1 Tax=Mucilaginibacter sp. TaxID=1882438 RepID=UPI00262425B2|nr:hypothetical protein [Mucilaginibacter sp.]MDB5126130.1 hypothetical protein [Mucilaginibacter sp.]
MEIKPHKKWTSRINKWENISVDEYKFIFEQAKEKLDDVLSETESITDKSIKIGTAVVAFLGFYLGLVIQNHLFKSHKLLVASTFIFAIINLFVIIKLIFPSLISNRGCSPEASTTPDFDNDDDKGYYLQKLYYNSIGILQDKIDKTVTRNSNRILIYKIALASFALFLILMGISLGFII